MATALDLIKGALRNIAAYQSGDTIGQMDETDALTSLNDLLESWSIAKLNVYGSNENIVYFNAGQNSYTIGNPSNATLSLPNITGTITGNTITTTSVPSQLIAGNSILTASTITDLQSIVPANTYVTAVTATTITLSQNVTSPSNGNDQIYWTVPGNFGIPRPLRISSAFTRLNGLDFTINVTMSQERFNEILYKAQPGPWPTDAWYNPLMPYGVLKVYQMPGNSAELHLFTDTILADLQLNQTFVLPQGYARAIKWCLAEELWPQFWATVEVPTGLKKKAYESLALIKALNEQPAQVSRYDRALIGAGGRDGGWIIHGGYR